MTAVSANRAYAEWAPTYESETAVSRLENLVVGELGIDTRGKRLLDVACGTGRRLRNADASIAVGVDASQAMLRAGGSTFPMIQGDARALPICGHAFDVVWCRLAIGHIPEVKPVLAELSRVLADGGRIVVTDLAPVAYAAGHRRTFRAADGEVMEVEHFVHDADSLMYAASLAGLRLHGYRAGAVDERVRGLYEQVGAHAAYDRQRGEVLVHALVFAAE